MAKLTFYIDIIITKNMQGLSQSDKLKSEKIRAEIDTRNEKIGYKIREHSNLKVPAILAIG